MIDLNKLNEIKKDMLIMPKKEIIKKYEIKYVELKNIINGKYICDEFGHITGKSSIIRKLPDEVLRDLFITSSSYSDIINKIGLDVRVSYINMLKIMAKNRGYDINALTVNRKNIIKNRTTHYRVSDDKIFCENSTYNKKLLKGNIIRNNLIEYKCSECQIIDTYNGKPIVLQLDHINGNNKDNRLLNLRFLCPMCHSQTETFTGKNIKRKEYYCKKCNAPIIKNSIYCSKCKNLDRKKFEISKHELEQLIKEKPMTSIGVIFGVSDNAIRKRCKKLEIEIPRKHKNKEHKK